MNKPLLAAAVLFSAALGAQNPPAPSGEPFAALQFLVGTWEAKTEGGSAGATSSGTYTFQWELRKHILARHTAAAGCKGPADFDCDHSDLLYIYQDPASHAPKAIYFDNEGHTILYDVSTPAPNTAVFVSAESKTGPQFRLVYQRKERVMHGKFQMRMPGQSDFKSYLEWSGEQR
jgi:hypothetical protein